MYRTSAKATPVDSALAAGVPIGRSRAIARPVITPAAARRLFIGTIFVAGTAAFAASLLAPSSTQLAGLIFVIALIAVSEGFATRLYSDGHISISFMGVLIAALALGPTAAALAATTVALAGFVSQGRSFTKLLFNFGQHNIAAFFAARIALAAGPDPAASLLPAVALGAVLGLALFALTSGAVTCVIALSSRRSLSSIYGQSFNWMLPHYVGLGAVAGGLANVYEGASIAALLILSVPLVLSRLSIAQVIEKTRATVSALEQTNARLREADAANRAILEAIPDVLFRLSSGGGGARITRAFRGDTPGDSRRPLPPDASAVLAQMAMAAEATGQAQVHEYRLGGPNGEQRDYEARVVPARDGEPLLMLRDISDRKRAERAQRLSGELRRTVTSNTPLLLFATDSGGIIQLLEGQGLEPAGIEARELIGKPLAHALGEGVFVEEALAVVRRGSVVNTSAEIGGRIFELHLSPVADGDGATGVVGVGLDVTERRRVEEAMVQAQKLESLAVMAGGIAHDFNNLLTGVVGNADLALAELPPGAAATATIAQIKLAGQRAAELAQQMLAYSGKGRLVVEPVDPGVLVEETSALLRSSIGRGIVFDVATEPALPMVEADATQVRQVVMNLVINAADAIGQGAGHIRVSTRCLSISREQLAEMCGAPDIDPGDYVSIEVADDGCGMDPDTMSRIFDPFFTTKMTGHGLGLAGVLGITRSHRGAIKVESEPGRGTTFTILLPALARHTGEAPAERPPERLWRGQGTVLVIDDDVTVRTLVARAARQFGLEAIEAEDGLAGVAEFRAHRGRIDCVLLDMTMPRLGGAETLARIREMDPAACVVLISGYAEDEATARALGQVPNGFIHKPFSLETLRETLRSVFDPAVVIAGKAA